MSQDWKSETHDVARADLRKRLTRSLLAGAVFLAAVVGTFTAIRVGPESDGLPSALRNVQFLNEKVGRKIYSSDHQAPLKPAPTHEPRVNGSIGLEDDVELESFRVKVESGDRVLSLSIADLEKLPRSQASVDFKCVEGWTEVFQYAGVSFADFMKAEKVGLHSDGTPYPYVGLETPDGKYYVSLDIESIMHPQTILAFEMNGGELAVENGYPVRLMIPNKYGIKSLKRVGRIYFSDTRPPDYWNRRGYDWLSSL